MTPKERVKVLRTAGFTGYDRRLDSKVQKPDKYGVELTINANTALEAVATGLKSIETANECKRPSDRHKAAKRISHRLTAERRQEVDNAIKSCGYGTVQGWLEVCVYRLLAEAKRKAPVGLASGRGAQENITHSKYHELEEMSNDRIQRV